ncbi:hypothetical protein [Geomonas subterranea]|uniref:hypothetical protein n=1 Tax=Geomonas subterranea TaxID=2847989 RepID=UPI001CD612B1|nr:hypothetical protein [Geomonas fuzhouensis]
MKKILCAQIAVSLSETDIDIAVNPDHPYLLSPPDLLLGRNGKLLAVYEPHREELSEPNSLLARLALSRLALPAHCQHILVVDEDGTSLGSVDNSFDKVIESVDTRKIPTIIEDRTRLDSAILREVKETHFLRFQVLYESSLLQFNRSHFKKNCDQPEIAPYPRRRFEAQDKVYLSDWLHDGRRRRPSRLFSKADWGVYSALEKTPEARQLRALCLGSVRLITDLDNGIPFSRIDEANLLITDCLHLNRFDPLKPIRGTAFSGLAFCPASSVISAGKYYRHIIDQVGHVSYEYYKKKNRRIKGVGVR